MSAADLWASAPLSYYPGEADFSDPRAADFSAGERLEFIEHDLASALASYRLLAESPDRLIQAGALARVARVARKLDRPAVALQAFDRLAPLGSATALGRPADLVASVERCALLSRTDQPERLAAEARQFERRLVAGDWRMSRAQFYFYRGLVRQWLRQPSSDDGNAPGGAAREIIAAGVLIARDVSQKDDAIGGRQTFGAGTSQAVIVWRRSEERIAALVATPAYIQRAWFHGLREIENSQRASISLSSPSGPEWFHAGVTGEAVRRPADETRLPFNLRVASSDPAGDTATFTRRRRLLGGMVAALGLIVVVGGYVTARGLARELAAARLQSDFVAAVSHEFRTPVASVRQLSELLGRRAGRRTNPGAPSITACCTARASGFSALSKTCSTSAGWNRRRRSIA